MTKQQATLWGCSAILMWAALAFLTIATAPMPALQLNAVTFGIGGLLGLAWTCRQGFSRLKNVTWHAYAFGAAGLFFYHLIYFTAFRIAPAASTGLVVYLWPLFIVIFSGLLPGENLAWRSLVGASLGLVGAGIVILASPNEATGNWLGYGLAFLAALIWAGYSVLSRRFGTVPSEAVTVYCLITAVLSALCHLLFEHTVWPETAYGWGALLLLGLGPVGAAFFTWDIGMKHGNIQFLGVAAFATPLASTVILVFAGITAPSYALAVAAALITGGAALAAYKSP